MSSTPTEQAGLAAVFQPAVLPCRRTVQSRLVKVALYEHLATFPGGPPNPHHFRLYSEWAKHDWGIILTGNVQVAADHLSLGRDIVLPHDLQNPTEQDLLPFRRLARAMHGDNSTENKPLAIMQLNHAGRQSCNFIGGRRIFRRPLAPSAVPMGLTSWRKATLTEALLNKAVFQTPKEMTEEDILNVVVRFVYGAVFAQKAGFDGIQLHAAHGYLLAQFLSPKTNKRTDAYSCDKALGLIYTIVAKIRALTPPEFAIGIKLNAADYTNSTTGPNESLTDHEQRAMQHFLTIARWGLIDFLEISGGDYETPDFLASTSPTKRQSKRQAFFTRFSQQAVQTLSSASDIPTPPLILLTGGLRTPALLTTALASKHADLVGVGRAAIRSPDIPTILKSKLATSSTSERGTPVPDDWDAPFAREPELKDPSFLPLKWLWDIFRSVKMIGAGAEVAWYTLLMREVASLPMSDGEPTRPSELDCNLTGLQCTTRMFFWKLPTEIENQT